MLHTINKSVIQISTSAAQGKHLTPSEKSGESLCIASECSPEKCTKM